MLVTGTKGRVALITGGNGGIGRATADRLARDGYRVFVTSRSAVPGPIAPGIELIRLNTHDNASVAACVQEVITQAGRIDVLVNSIGNGLIGAVEEVSDDEARLVVEDVFWSMARVIQAVIPHMREKGGGRIISMSSLGGLMGFPFSAFYCAGKYAMEGFCEALHLEVRQFGIGVSLIEPAGVHTPVAGNVPMAAIALPAYGGIRYKVAKDVENMMRSGLAPADVAEAIVRALADRKPRVRYLVGGPAKAMGLFLRFAPERLITLAKRKMNGLP